MMFLDFTTMCLFHTQGASRPNGSYICSFWNNLKFYCFNYFLSTTHFIFPAYSSFKSMLQNLMIISLSPYSCFPSAIFLSLHTGFSLALPSNSLGICLKISISVFPNFHLIMELIENTNTCRAHLNKRQVCSL